MSRGQLLLSQGEYQEAVRVCRLGLLADPDNDAGRLVLAQSLLALKRSDEVLAEARTLLATNPFHSQALIVKAKALLQKGDFTQAEMSLEAMKNSKDPEVEKVLFAIHSRRQKRRPNTVDLDSDLDVLTIETSATRVHEYSESSLSRGGDAIHATVGAIELGGADLEPLSEEYDEIPLASQFQEEANIKQRDANRLDQEPGPALDALFPGEESGLISLDQISRSLGPDQPTNAVDEGESVGVGKKQTEDMRLIRHALGVADEPLQSKNRIDETGPTDQRSGPPTQKTKKSNRQKKRSIPLAIAAYAVVVLVASVALGMKIRQSRLGGQIQDVMEKAHVLSQADTYSGHRDALGLYRQLNALVESDQTRDLLSEQEARVAAEFGESTQGIEERVASSSSNVARAYWSPRHGAAR